MDLKLERAESENWRSSASVKERLKASKHVILGYNRAAVNSPYRL
jgi:hypothetical protein